MAHLPGRFIVGALRSQFKGVFVASSACLLYVCVGMEGHMVMVASFTRYDTRSDRMLQPNYKLLIQALGRRTVT